MRAMTRDRTRCPNCGERVQPLAAGCAICGADLDTTRWDSGPSLFQRIGSWFTAFGFGPRVSGATVVAVLVIVYVLLYVL
jgi:predicted amidophosphoribosyltransferase